MDDSSHPKLSGWSDRIASLEKGVLTTMVAFLIAFSLLQIILRNFFSTGLVWADSMLRHVVLWVSLLGAVRATAENKHIQIDILPKLLPGLAAHLVTRVSNGLSLVVCLILLYASAGFVATERQGLTTAFEEVPLWWLLTVFPISFAAMAVRFGFQIIGSFLDGSSGAEP